MRSLMLNSGHLMPLVGLGTYTVKDPEDTKLVIDAALKSGYRAFDTAQLYENEAILGEAFESLLPKHGLKREDIFITSKLDTKNQGQKAKEAITNSLKDLRVKYIDLYLIHWPYTEGLDKMDSQNLVNRSESWKIMEDAVKEGKLKSIGVSNYAEKHIKEMKEGPYKAQILPAVNQVEFHPYLYQKKLLNYCHDNNIRLEAYSPLGHKSKDLIQDSLVVDLAKKHKKQPAQIILRWDIQHEVIVIPKSSNPDRISQNIDIFNFELSPEEMKSIDELNQDKHYIPYPDMA